MQKEKNEIRMLCVPGYQKPLKEQLTAFLEYLMPRFSHEDRAGELFLYECHRVLTDEWSDMTDFLALLNAGTDTDGRCRKQVPAVDDYKVIFAGYWVDKGEPDKDMQEFLQTLDNKKVVLFQTLGAEAYSEHGISSLANAGRYLSTGCKVVGTLSIRGAIALPTTYAHFAFSKQIG